MEGKWALIEQNLLFQDLEENLERIMTSVMLNFGFYKEPLPR